MAEFQSAAEKLEFPKILKSLISYATSDLGKKAAEHLAPTTNLAEITTELSRVDELKRILESDDPFPIDGLHDIQESLHRAGVENSLLTPAELLAICQTLLSSRNIRSFVLKRKEICPELESLCQQISINKILEYNISQAIDDNGNIKDSASKELRTIRSTIVAEYGSLRKQLERILKNVSDQGLTQDDIITTRDGRMVIPVKVEQKHQVPGFIHSSSASGATVFIEPAETLALNNEIRELHFREQREIEKILRLLTAQVREQSTELLGSQGLLAHIDLVYAKAKYSVQIKGNKPFLKENGPLKIVQGRHPILLVRHSTVPIVPLTFEIGGGYSTVLITGPNAGGKSVAMKTVGILALMVQSGIHIPAAPDSEFPVFNQIHVDIGDDQSIENDLSTFSSHVRRLNDILNSVDNHSMVLIDELGAGTDPSEGGALGAVVLRQLTRLGAFTIATTHHVGLKAFAHETEGMENGAMEFDQTSLLPTYNFKIGIPGSSYALEIAKRLGMPSKLIAEAEAMVGEQKSHLEQLIVDLEARSQSLSKEIEKIAVEKLNINELVQKYESKLENLKQEIRQVKLQAVEEAQMIISQANTVIERSIQEIKQKGAERKSIVESKAEIRQMEENLNALEKSLANVTDEGSKHGQSFRKGTLVRLKSSSQTGEVLQEPNTEGQLQVVFENIKMRVHVNDILSVTQPSTPVRAATIELTNEAPSREVDVRGLYGDEAIEVVDKFLDNALLADLHRVDIIHGKGTGALRKKISNFLGSDNRVKSQRLGEWNEGGAGVTVVELKD